MKKILKKAAHLFLMVILTVSAGYTQSATDGLSLENQIWDNYQRYRENTISSRLFKHDQIVPLIQKHTQNGLVTNEIIGKSHQGRSIHHLTAGKGKTKVLLWSQMHGDEATATMALFDLFNFMSADDEFNTFRKHLLNKLELHFVPMLNPDGAQIWTRRNAMNIDINRDAQNLATPEAKILMSLGKSIRPKFGFNLHDQSIYYAAGNTAKAATISFLAPAFNENKDMNEVRTNAIKVIAAMNKNLQSKIPGQVAKYDDTYDARCFGDQFMGMGISSILIESGGYKMDPEKQEIRKLNFYALITALNSIANSSYLQENPNDYWAVPDNNRNLYDLIVRNVKIPGENTPVDLGILRHHQPDTTSYRWMNYSGKIEKIGNLEKSFGYEEIDAKDLVFINGMFNQHTKPSDANFILYDKKNVKYIVLEGLVFGPEIEVQEKTIFVQPPIPKKP